MWNILLVLALLATALSKQLPTGTELSTTAIATATDEDTTPWPGALAPADTLAVACERDSMHITITLAHNDVYGDSAYDTFNGIVYPAGLGSNSSCLREYVAARGDLQYTLPLKGCNTMSTDNGPINGPEVPDILSSGKSDPCWSSVPFTALCFKQYTWKKACKNHILPFKGCNTISTDNDDGTVEYFNNIIVQPHLRLVTGQGRGYHVRCRYRRRDLTQFHIYPRASALSSNALDEQEEFDEESGLLPSVTMKIYKGDPKDKQVASNVRIGDTLTLVVSLEKQRRFGLLVSECSVRDGLGWAEQSLIANDGCPLDGDIMGLFQYGSERQDARVSFPAHKFPYTASVYYTCEVKLCDLNHPTDCEPCSRTRRVRREDSTPATVEVFSGLYVNEQDSLDNDQVTSEKKEDEICISQRNFAIGICIAGVILMACVIAAIACILARRRGKSHSGSSLYSGPYTNTGYSHAS